MAAQGFFRKGARACGEKVSVFQTNRLLVQAGVPNEGRRDLGIVRFPDADPVFGHIFLSDLKGGASRDGLDHLGIQQAKSLSAARNLISHCRCAPGFGNRNCRSLPGESSCVKPRWVEPLVTRLFGRELYRQYATGMVSPGELCPSGSAKCSRRWVLASVRERPPFYLRQMKADRSLPV